MGWRGQGDKASGGPSLLPHLQSLLPLGPHTTSKPPLGCLRTPLFTSEGLGTPGSCGGGAVPSPDCILQRGATCVGLTVTAFALKLNSGSVSRSQPTLAPLLPPLLICPPPSFCPFLTTSPPQAYTVSLARSRCCLHLLLPSVSPPTPASPGLAEH